MNVLHYDSVGYLTKWIVWVYVYQDTSPRTTALTPDNFPQTIAPIGQFLP